MIIPGIFKDIFKRPELNLAWIFLALNIIIYVWTQISFSQWPSKSLSMQIKDKNFSASVLQMYVQTLDPIEKKEREATLTISDALRDHRFWSRIATYPFSGDVVQIEMNRTKLKQFQSEYFESSQYQLGLGSIETSPWAWLTYQFTHANLIHLLGNIIVIFLLLSYMQQTIGFFWLISTYLLGGFGGGVVYLYFDGAGSMSVVGASASACALMAFLVIVQRNLLMPWSYIIAPVDEGYGVIYLPVFFIFPVFIMSDFISALWDPAGVTSSIAVSAHIGGAIVGFILGFIYLLEKSLVKYLMRVWQVDENQLTEI